MRAKKIGACLLAAALALGLILPAAAQASAADWLLESAARPGLGDEWTVLALARGQSAVPDGYYDDYYRAVARAVANREHDSWLATEHARVVLALTAAGFDPTQVAGCDLTASLAQPGGADSQGAAAMAYALLALDCGGYQPDADRGALVSALCSRQLANGGFSVDARPPADPDVTAIVLQALAPYRGDPAVDAAVARALVWLSTAQLPSGGFASWGIESCESVAQAIIALCTLAGEAETPDLEAMTAALESYRLPDGSYCHIPGGSANRIATQQAALALVAAQRMADGQGALYAMAHVTPRPAPEGDTQSTAHPHVQVPPPIQAAEFSDIDGSPWQSAIRALAGFGIIEGRGDGRFCPDEALSRAELAALLVRALGLPDASADSFSDVPPHAWYASAADTAAHYGLIVGVGQGRFDPLGRLSLQEACVIMARAAALCGMDAALPEALIADTLALYDDGHTVAHWATGGVALCIDSGILTRDGMDIAPLAPVSRGELAGMLWQLLTLSGLVV